MKHHHCLFCFLTILIKFNSLILSLKLHNTITGYKFSCDVLKVSEPTTSFQRQEWLTELHIGKFKIDAIIILLVFIGKFIL